MNTICRNVYNTLYKYLQEIFTYVIIFCVLNSFFTLEQLLVGVTAK